MKRDYYLTPKPTRLMRLFWSAAGGDRFILEKSTYSDQVKYMCLGGIIIATGLMAAIAGGYAFYTIFSPKGDALGGYLQVKHMASTSVRDETHIPTMLISVIFGALWGAMIFNLDRFIVSSTGKGDGTEAITVEELKGALPRIIMGAIIAMTISKPVEIRMFKSEIDRRIQQVQDSVELVNVKLAENTFNKSSEVAKSNLAPIENQMKNFERRLSFLDSMITYENTHGGCKGKCEENKKERVIILQRIENIKKSDEYIENRAEIKGYQEQFNISKEKAKVDKLALDGLLLRIKLSHEIAGTWISLFITLLFMAIELTPIFFKLMLTKTPYDYLEENIKELMKAEEGILIDYNYYPDKQGQERDLVIHYGKEKLNSERKALLKAQKELSEYAIGKYTEEMKKKIDSNPSEYVKMVNANTDPQV